MYLTEGKTHVISPSKPQEATENATEEEKIVTLLVPSQEDYLSQATPYPTSLTTECSGENVVLSPPSETSVASNSVAVSTSTQDQEVPSIHCSTDIEAKSASGILPDNLETEEAVEPCEVVAQPLEDVMAPLGESPEAALEGPVEVSKDSVSPSEEVNLSKAAELPKDGGKPNLTLNISPLTLNVSPPNSEEEGVTVGNQTPPLHPIIFPG